MQTSTDPHTALPAASPPSWVMATIDFQGLGQPSLLLSHPYTVHQEIPMALPSGCVRDLATSHPLHCSLLSWNPLICLLIYCSGLLAGLPASLILQTTLHTAGPDVRRHHCSAQLRPSNGQNKSQSPHNSLENPKSSLLHSTPTPTLTSSPDALPPLHPISASS